MTKFTLEEVELKTQGSTPEKEPDFTTDWAIIGVNSKGDAYWLAVDDGFTAYDYMQEGCVSDYGCIDVPQELLEGSPAVYKVTGLVCTDSGRRDTQDGVEYDSPTFGKGTWEKLLDVDDAIPLQFQQPEKAVERYKKNPVYKDKKNNIPYLRHGGYILMKESDFKTLHEHAEGEFQNVLKLAVDKMGWPEVRAFENALQHGQSPMEDGGGFFMRCIGALLGIKQDPVKNYKQAVQAMISEHTGGKDGKQ